MKNPTTIQGIRTPEDFAEHIRRVEQYIAREDPETVFLDALKDRIQAKGIASTSVPERQYFAVDQFLSSVFNHDVFGFFNDSPQEIRDYVLEFLTERGEPDLADCFAELQRQFKNGELTPADAQTEFAALEPENSYAEAFVVCAMELDRTLNQFGLDKDLFRL